MIYRIEWDNKAVKELNKLQKTVIQHILSKVSMLIDNPFHKKLTDSDSSFRMRVGDYRIIYEVDIKVKLIIIFRVRHRKNVHKQ